MITRNTIGDNFPILVDYLHYGRPDAPVDKQPLILFAAGVRTDSSQAMGADFAWGSTLNTSLAKPVWHTAISFNPDDAPKLTNEKMLAVAQDFCKELGLLNTQCVIIRHFDKEDNQHLHILVNRVADDGHSIRDNRNYHRSKEAVELLCERHGLTPWAGQRPELQHPERIVGAYDKAGAQIRQALAYGLQTATERATLWEKLKQEGITTNESGRGVTFTKDGFTFKGSQVARQYSLGGIDQQLGANRLVQAQQAEARAAEAWENEQLRRRGQQVLAELVDQKTFANRTELTGQVLAHGYTFVSSLEREMQLRHEASGREFALVDVQPGGPTAPSFWTQVDAVIQARAAEAAAQAERRELARQETTQVLTRSRDSGLRQPEEFFDRLRAQPVDLVQDAQTQEITHVIHRQSKEKFAWAEVQPGGVGAPPLVEQLAAAVQAEAQRAANQRREEDRGQVERMTTQVCDERQFYTPAELHAGLKAGGVTWLPPAAQGQAHQFQLDATGQQFAEQDVLRGRSMAETLAGAEERRCARRLVIETQIKHDVQETLYAPQTPLTGFPDYQRQLEACGYQLVRVPGRALEIEHNVSGERFDVAHLRPGGPTAAPLVEQVKNVVAQQQLEREIPRQATTDFEQVLAARNFIDRAEFNQAIQGKGYQFVLGVDGREHLLHEASKHHFPLAQVRPHGRELDPQVNEVIAARQAERQRGPLEAFPTPGAQPGANQQKALAAAGQRDKSSTLAKPVVPIVVPEGTTSSGPLVIAGQPAAGVSGTGAPVPTTAEGPVSPPPVGAEATSSVMSSAAVLSTAQPGEQTTVAAGSSTVNQPPHAADAPSPTVPALGSPAEAASAPATSATAETAFERTLARWEAQKLADAEDERLAVLYYAWLQLEKEVKQQVTAATHEALATGIAFSTLLYRKGLELLPATSDAPICVRHRTSGESFSAEEVPLPSWLLTTASQASAQYGVVQMADADLRKAPERLAEVRAHLLEVGLTVGLVEPATARQPAQLTWAFDPQQANLDLPLVMAKLDAVQAARNAWVLEAPHAWQSGSGKANGLAEPQLYWDNRAGQFNQARLELDTIDERSAGRIDRVRQALSKQGVGLGPVQTDAQGRLSFELRYHTLAPTIDAIDTVLIQARNSGFDLRESEQQQQARGEGIQVVAERDAGKEYSR